MTNIIKDLRTFKFSKRKLDKVSYSDSDKDIVYHDTDSYGLKLRVTKNQKTFYFIRKINGKTIKVKLGLFSHRYTDAKLRKLITVENARRSNIEVKSKVEKGKDLSNKETVDKQTESFTVDDAMEQFIELFKIDIQTGERAEQSLVRIIQDYNNHIKKHLGSKQFTAVTKIEVKNVLFNIKKKSFNVYNKCLTLLKSLYYRIIDFKDLEIENPVCSGSLKKVPSTKRTRFLQPSEMKKFFEAVLEEDLIYQDIILCLLFTAQRKLNVLSMKWTALDLKNGLWHLTKKEVKGKNAIVVPLNNILITRLANRYHHCDKQSGYVFPSSRSKTGHISEKTGKGSFWSRIRIRAELWHEDKDIRVVLHDLRRSLASYQAINNTSLQIIADTLGQKDLTQTQIYARLQTKVVGESMNHAIDSIISNVEGDQNLMSAMQFERTEKTQSTLSTLFKKIINLDVVRNNSEFTDDVSQLFKKITDKELILT